FLCLIDHGLQAAWSFNAGNFEAILSAIRKSLRGSWQVVAVRGQKSEAFDKLSGLLHGSILCLVRVIKAANCRAPLNLQLVDLLRLRTAADPVQHVVLNPLAIPPFGRIDRHAVQEKAKVQVVASGETGGAAPSHHI